MPFDVGQFASDYEILDVLGKGGMGRVYRVRNVISNRTEAMKVLLDDVAAEADLSQRFLSEIRILAQLDHPNIAKFHTAFKVENHLVMVMEFVEGVTLSDRAKQGAMPLDEVLSYVTQTLAALAYAHQNGVIHRDIKPSNIMITPHGVGKLMDFGIAKSSIEQMHTRPGTTVGSMLYMSPEQVRGSAVDARSDLYSVGVVLYELTAGRRPFEAENTYGVLDAQLNTVPKPPIELNPALPPVLNEIIMTALAKEPMHRFQSADAFRKALESIRRPAPSQPSAQPATVAIPAPAARRHGHRGLWMATGAAACVCVLIAAGMTLPRVFHSAAKTKDAAVQTTATPVKADAPAPASDPALPPSSPAPAAVSPAGASIADSAPAVVSNPPTNPKHVAPAAGRVPVASPRVTIPPPAQPADSPSPQVAPVQQPQIAPPAGPSQEEIDQAHDELIKLEARAGAVKSSLDTLRQQQAQDGVGLRQDIAASANRMDSYLLAAEQALQNNSIQSARKHMEHAEEELTRLEQFFGR